MRASCEALSRTLVPYLIRDDTGNLREDRLLYNPDMGNTLIRGHRLHFSLGEEVKEMGRCVNVCLVKHNLMNKHKAEKRCFFKEYRKHQ